MGPLPPSAALPLQYLGEDWVLDEDDLPWKASEVVELARGSLFRQAPEGALVRLRLARQLQLHGTSPLPSPTLLCARLQGCAHPRGAAAGGVFQALAARRAATARAGGCEGHRVRRVPADACTECAGHPGARSTHHLMCSAPAPARREAAALLLGVLQEFEESTRKPRNGGWVVALRRGGTSSEHSPVLCTRAPPPPPHTHTHVQTTWHLTQPT